MTKSLTIHLTRRQLALALLAAAGGGTVAVWSASRHDRTVVALDLPSSGNPFNPTYEEFLALSKIVLLRPALDDALARRMYAIFRDEPWGPKHIGHAYAALRSAVVKAAQPGAAQTPVDLSVLEAAERWFVGHLVTTWYLGIYYHEERPIQRITLAGALMYDAAKGIVPIPYYDSVGFGRWSEPPESR